MVATTMQEVMADWNVPHQQFAMVQDLNRITVFSTAHAVTKATKTNLSNVLHNLKLPFQLNTNYSCLQYYFQTQQQTPSKKSSSTTSLPFLLAGTKTGKLLLWNLSNGEILKQITVTGEEEEEVAEHLEILNVHVLPSKEFLLITPHQIYLINNPFDNKKIKVQSLYTCTTLISSSHFHPTTHRLLLGFSNGSVMQWDYKTKQVIAQWQVYSSSAVHMLQSINEVLCIAASKQDRHVIVFDMKQNAPSQVLSMDSNAISLDAQLFTSSTEECQVVCVTNEMKCFVWKLQLKKKMMEQKWTTQEKSLFFAKSSGDYSLVIAYDSISHPKFKTISNWVALSLEDEKREESEEEEEEEEKKSSNTVTPKENGKVKHLNASNMEDSKARFQTILSEKKKEEDEEDLEDKIQSLDTNAFIKQFQMSKSQDESIPVLDFSATLVQCIKSGDQTVLKQILSQQDTELIKLTLKKLPTGFAAPLLTAILEQYQKNEVHDNIQLVHWLKPLLIFHTSTILSHPKILDKLAPFYHAISQRVSNFNKLVDVSGRLDLLLSLAGYKSMGVEVEDVALSKAVVSTNTVVDSDEEDVIQDVEKEEEEEDEEQDANDMMLLGLDDDDEDAVDDEEERDDDDDEEEEANGTNGVAEEEEDEDMEEDL